MTITYRIFDPADCPAEVFSLRYRIYVEELHRKQFYADHESKMIRDPLDDFAHHAVAFDGDDVIACVRVNFVREGSVGRYYELYGIADLPEHERATASTCTRNMVLREYRKTGVSVRMLKTIYKFGMENGMTTCFMDVNPPLERLFERFGYRYLYQREHPEYGLVSVYRLDVLECDYLTKVRSPFAEICREYLSSNKSQASLLACPPT